MMLIIKIETDNEAFQPYIGDEIAAILRKIAAHYEGQLEQRMKLRDINGNTVGQAYFTDTDVTKANNHSLPL